MLFVVSLYAILFLPDVLDQLRGEVIAALLYVENWFLIFRHLSYFQGTGRLPLLQHVWSLAVEEQFYLFWPLILVLVLTVWGKSRRALLVGVLVGIVVSTLEMAILYHPYTDPSRVYYGTDTRVATLLLGAALAFVWAPWRLVGRTGRNAAVLLDLAALASGFVLCWMFLNVSYFDPSLYRGGFLLVALVSAVLIARDGAPRVAVGATTPRHRRVPLDRRALVRHLSVALADLHGHAPALRRPPDRHPAPRAPVGADVRGSCAVVPLRRGAGPPRRARAVVGAVPHLVRGDPTQARGPLRARRQRYHPGPGGDRRRPRRRGSAAAPAGLGDKTSVVIRPGQTTTTTAAPGATTPTTVPATTAPPVTTLPPTTVTAIGDSVMLGAANQLAATVDAMFGNQPVTGVDAAESRQFSAGVDLIQQLQGRRPAGPGRRRPARHQRHRRPG